MNLTRRKPWWIAIEGANRPQVEAVTAFLRETFAHENPTPPACFLPRPFVGAAVDVLRGSIEKGAVNHQAMAEPLQRERDLIDAGDLAYIGLVSSTPAEHERAENEWTRALLFDRSVWMQHVLLIDPSRYPDADELHREVAHACAQQIGLPLIAKAVTP